MHTYLLYILKIICNRFRINSDSFSQVYRRYRRTQKNKKYVARGNKTPKRIQIFDRLLIIQTGLFSLISYFWKAPYNGKYAVQSTSRKGWGHKGSATIEAVCIMPLMLFAFWAFYSMGQIYIMENQIYQAAMNTAGYLAEYAYLAEEFDQTEGLGTQLLGIGAANVKLRYYLEDTTRISQYVVGGTNGLLITGPEILDEEGFICIQIHYRVRIPIPLLSKLSMPVCVQVRQKAYVGYREGQTNLEEERYVYVAEYSTVYHSTRNCSHLRLTIRPVTKAVLNVSYGNLLPCAYCGDEPAETYYITDTGDCYHTSTHCTGLKRTVRRVKISEVSGYAPCSRCGNALK